MKSDRHVSILLFFPSFITSLQRDLHSGHFFKESQANKNVSSFFQLVSITSLYMRVCVDLYDKATDSARRLFTSVAKDKNGYRSLKVSLTSDIY